MNKQPETRIARKFTRLRQEGRAGLVTFLTAGDPDFATASDIMQRLPGAGADLIEIGMPFSDPMADGPAIQASSLRALTAGMTLARTLDMVRAFRKTDNHTPVILMGYYNPIYIYGVDRFLGDAAGLVDGLIMVDLPPEEESELCLPALQAGINFIYLTAPTTDDARLPRVVEHASGFIYYVSIAGITGTAAAAIGDVDAQIQRIRRHTDLPVAVGFGIRTPEHAANIARIADAAVVGSALIDVLKENLDENNQALPGLADNVLSLVTELAKGVRSVDKTA